MTDTPCAVGSHWVTEVGSIVDALGIRSVTPEPEPRSITHCGYAGASVRTAWRTRRPESILQSVYDSPRTGTTLSLAYTGSCASADALIASAELSAEHPIDLDITDVVVWTRSRPPAHRRPGRSMSTMVASSLKLPAYASIHRPHYWTSDVLAQHTAY